MAQPYTAYQPSVVQPLGYQLDLIGQARRRGTTQEREYYEEWLKWQWRLDAARTKERALAATPRLVDLNDDVRVQEMLNEANALLAQRRAVVLSDLLASTKKFVRDFQATLPPEQIAERPAKRPNPAPPVYLDTPLEQLLAA